jgi:hypothetical protein
MHVSQLTPLVAFILGAIAQTPSGFNPTISTPLKVTFGNNAVDPAGLYLPVTGKANIQSSNQL